MGEKICFLLWLYKERFFFLHFLLCGLNWSNFCKHYKYWISKIVLTNFLSICMFSNFSSNLYNHLAFPFSSNKACITNCCLFWCSKSFALLGWLFSLMLTKFSSAYFDRISASRISWLGALFKVDFFIEKAATFGLSFSQTIFFLIMDF